MAGPLFRGRKPKLSRAVPRPLVYSRGRRDQYSANQLGAVPSARAQTFVLANRRTTSHESVRQATAALRCSFGEHAKVDPTNRSRKRNLHRGLDNDRGDRPPQGTGLAGDEPGSRSRRRCAGAVGSPYDWRAGFPSHDAHPCGEIGTMVSEFSHCAGMVRPKCSPVLGNTARDPAAAKPWHERATTASVDSFSAFSSTARC